MASEPQDINSQSKPNTNEQCWSGILDIDDYYVLYVHDYLESSCFLFFETNLGSL